MFVRRLYPRSGGDLRRELRRIGCATDDADRIAMKVESIPLKVDGNDSEIAELLKISRHLEIETVVSNVSHKSALLILPKDKANEFRSKLRSTGAEMRIITRHLEGLLTSERGETTPRSFRVGDRTYIRTTRPFIMGILNVTPDSFSDGGYYLDQEKALDRALRMVEEGADFIDIGGESTRPGANEVELEEEIGRVIPVVEKLASKANVPISIDTKKSEVAKRAIAAGAKIVNDISALRGDPHMAEVISDANATIILMHMQGEPRTMQSNPHYDDLMGEVHQFLLERTEFACHSGIQNDRILVDPGIGFGKREEDNFEILGRLAEFADIAPVLVGPSRKSFIGKTLNLPVEERQFGTAAAVAVAVVNRADVIRVHDVREMIQVAKIADSCMSCAAEEEHSDPCAPRT